MAAAKPGKKAGKATQGMAGSSTRALWKGAISFGLVHIPVGLYSATAESDLDFDWLDKRTMDPVGYKRINKKTGREIDKDNIVKGIQYQKGEYVVLSKEEIAEAYPRTTQTIEIEAFVDVEEVPFVYLERPYYTAPINKGEKVYALLREALQQTGKAGIARVVIQTKQHLAILVPMGPALVLNLLRWGDEIRSWEGLPLPAQSAKGAGLRETELKMARQLIADMAGSWSAEQYRDEFRDAIMQLVEAKAAAGETEEVVPLEEAPEKTGADVIDLTELLRRSLRGGAAEAAAPARAPAPAARKPPRREAANDDAPARAPRTRAVAAAKTGGSARTSVKPAARRKGG
jgi:DNA end-binding protein Ku